MRWSRSARSAGAASPAAGLGLPLTKALVEANNAEFSIKSRRDHGTLIEIAFPTCRRRSSAKRVPEDERPADTESGPKPLVLSSLTRGLGKQAAVFGSAGRRGAVGRGRARS